MKPLKGEKEIVVETKRKGKPPVEVKAVETTAILFMDYIHNKLLEAKKNGEKIEVRSV